MNNIQLMEAMTDLEDSYLTDAWNRLHSSTEERHMHVSAWRRARIAAVAALVLSSFAAAAALGADFRDFGKALVQPISLLKMIYIVGFLNGFRARTLGYLLLASFGAGMRLMVSERRDFWILGLSAPVIYALCELMIQSNQDNYLGLPYPAGVFALCFAVGYWLCTLVLLARRIIRWNRPAQERKAVIAVIALLILSSFTMAMAVNADFRETVFSIFHIAQKEIVPHGDGSENGELTQIGEVEIAEDVKSYYFRGDGVITTFDGLIFSKPDGDETASFYDLDENGLVPLDTRHADFQYTFRGTDFHIAYDYTVFDGALYLRPQIDSIANTDPYRYGWNITSAGIDDHTAWLHLQYYDGVEYSIYPLQIDVQTQEITDVLSSVSLEGLHPGAWLFSEDAKWAIIADFTTEQKSPYWLCNLKKGTLSPLSELVGRTVVESYFLDADTVVCYVENGEGIDVLRYDLTSGERSVVLFDVRRGEAVEGKAGMREIQYYGGHGKHVLLSTPDGSVEVLDLRDGRFVPLVGYEADDIDLTLESPDGRSVLFAWRQPDAAVMQSLGVLNLDTGLLKLLDRENRQTREEHLMSWLANNCFTILAYDENDTDGWYLYVYDFR